MSNLAAEAVGLVAGIVVTYAVVNRVIDARRNSDLKPLRSRFAVRVQTSLELMALGWAIGLAIAPDGDLPADLHEKVLTVIEEQKPDLAQTLRANQPTSDEPYVVTLARQAVELVGDITLTADRFPQLLVSDVELEEAVEDIEQTAHEAALILRNTGVSAGPGDEDTLALASLELLRKTSGLISLLQEKKNA